MCWGVNFWASTEAPALLASGRTEEAACSLASKDDSQTTSAEPAVQLSSYFCVYPGNWKVMMMLPSGWSQSHTALARTATRKTNAHVPPHHTQGLLFLLFQRNQMRHDGWQNRKMWSPSQLAFSVSSAHICLAEARSHLEFKR